MLWMMMMDGWKSMLGWYHHDDTPHPTWRVLSYGWYPRDTLLLFLDTYMVSIHYMGCSVYSCSTILYHEGETHHATPYDGVYH